MTKEQFLARKFNNPLDIVYHYYLEKRDPNKPLIQPRQLLTQVQMSGFVHLIVDRVMSYYDAKFGVVSLLSKDSKLIKQY
jgi:hypothetical protein